MRQCPTPEGGPGPRPLIAHRISGGDCVDRQREHYHKCHSCVFRGQAADCVLPETNGVHRNGAVASDRTSDPRRDQLRVEQVVELPSRNGVPAAGSRDKPTAVPDPAR